MEGHYTWGIRWNRRRIRLSEWIEQGDNREGIKRRRMRTWKRESRGKRKEICDEGNKEEEGEFH